MIALPQIDPGPYLDRIGLKAGTGHDFDTLAALQRSHLVTVPFENLDVWRKRNLTLSADEALTKIVHRRRGGWCFEVNTAFAALLRSLGFTVTPVAATVLVGERSPTPDHMALVVELEQPYLVDVGFGDSFIVPLALDGTDPQDGGSGTFGVHHRNGVATVYQLVDGKRVDQYEFRVASASFDDFQPACVRLQTDPDSLWHQKPFVTRLTGVGSDRVTLLTDRLKMRTSGEWSEQPVADWTATLESWFGFSLETSSTRSDIGDRLPGSLAGP